MLVILHVLLNMEQALIAQDQIPDHVGRVAATRVDHKAYHGIVVLLPALLIQMLPVQAAM